MCLPILWVRQKVVRREWTDGARGYCVNVLTAGANDVSGISGECDALIALTERLLKEVEGEIWGFVCCVVVMWVQLCSYN